MAGAAQGEAFAGEEEESEADAEEAFDELQSDAEGDGVGGRDGVDADEWSGDAELEDAEVAGPEREQLDDRGGDEDEACAG